MEILVGALVLLGFVAIVVRFMGRDSSGEIRLPRVVDDSIGMWALRRVTGRPLGERASDDELEDDPHLDPSVSGPTARVATARGAPAGVVSTRGVPAGVPAGVAPTAARDIAIRPPGTSRRPGHSASMLSPTPVLDLRRRQEGIAPPRRSTRRRRFAALGVAAVVLIVAVLALGFAAQQDPPQGQVLAATGRPQQPGQAAIGPGGGSTAAPTSTIAPDVTKPKAAITALTTSAIAGSLRLRLGLTWTLTDSGSGLRSQRLQRRTDGGAWVTVILASVSTRTAAFALSRGHTYTFRIRATDRAGNVGFFASKSIRI